MSRLSDHFWHLGNQCGKFMQGATALKRMSMTDIAPAQTVWVDSFLTSFDDKWTVWLDCVSLR